jgi:hypothetical protein
VKTVPEHFSPPVFGNLKKFSFSSRISGTRKMANLCFKREIQAEKKKERNMDGQQKRGRQIDRQKDIERESDRDREREQERETDRQTDKYRERK